MPFIDQIDIQGKRILGRFDFNVPIKDGQITDDSRIRAALPTIQHVLDSGGSLVACSHLGKPKGKHDPSLSLKPIAERLGQLLEREVSLASDCIGPEVVSRAEALQPGQILLLENLRFQEGETKNDPDMSRQLAELGDVYMNDAFGVVHRKHASVFGVAEHMATTCGGMLLKKEIEYLGKALADPDRPFVLIAGGAKVSSKLGILDNLLNKVNRVIIGGAMANTFRWAQGYPVGQSKIEADLKDDALAILDKARQQKVSLYLPVDYVLGEGVDADTLSGVFPFQDVKDELMILDTGPASHALFSEVLKDAATVVWNGPMGAFENPTFSQGSVNLAHTVGNLSATTIIGGGDTDALVHKCKLESKVSFISTGGGSFLEFLEGKELPGLSALGIKV
jgi:phosphoglycerate kinase